MGHGMHERRDYRGRAEVLSRVVAWLRAQTSPSAGVADLGDTDVVTRILRQLAFRGLARRLPGGWLPTPVLLNAARLKVSETA